MGLTEAQLELRRRGVGSSDVPVILGLQGSVVDLWLDKTKQRPVEVKQNRYQRRGELFEEAVARMYEDETGFTCDHAQTWSHPAYDWWLATPDRLVAEGGVTRYYGRILEAKTRAVARNWGQIMAPVEADVEAVLRQCQWELGVVYERFGISICDLVIYGPRIDDLEIVTIERNVEEENMLRDVVGHWWQWHVIEGNPPLPDASESYAQWQNSQPEGEQILDAKDHPELLELIEKHRWNCLDYAKAKDAKELTANALRSALRLVKKVRHPWGSLSYSWSKGAEAIDFEAVAKQVLERWQTADPSIDGAAILQELRKANTTRSSGGRRLHPYWKEEL